MKYTKENLKEKLEEYRAPLFVLVVGLFFLFAIYSTHNVAGL